MIQSYGRTYRESIQPSLTDRFRQRALDSRNKGLYCRFGELLRHRDVPFLCDPGKVLGGLEFWLSDR